MIDNSVRVGDKLRVKVDNPNHSDELVGDVVEVVYVCCHTFSTSISESCRVREGYPFTDTWAFDLKSVKNNSTEGLFEHVHYAER